MVRFTRDVTHSALTLLLFVVEPIGQSVAMVTCCAPGVHVLHCIIFRPRLLAQVRAELDELLTFRRLQHKREKFL